MVVDKVSPPVGPGVDGPSSSGPLSLLRRPSLLVALTVLLVAVPDAADPTGVELANITAADVGAVLLVAVMGLRTLARRDLQRLRDPLLLAPFLIVAAALITTIWSTDPVLSAVGIIRYAELYCVVPLAVVLVVKDRVDIGIVLGSVVALGVVEGAIGVYQAITGTGAGFQGQTSRAIGTFGADSVLAMATVVSIAQLVLLAVALRERGTMRVWAVAGVVVLLAPLLLSLSRGALVATAIAASVMLLATGVFRALQVGVLLVAGGLLGLALIASVSPAASQQVTSVADRIGSLGTVLTEPDSSVQDRYDLWSTAVSIWQTDPVTGVGIKQFPAYRDTHAPLGMSSGSELQTADSYSRGELLSPHSQYLLLLSEQGLIGLGAFVVLLVALFARLAVLLRTVRSDTVEQLLLLLSLGLFVWYGLALAYGDLSGATAVLFAVLLGVQLRSAALPYLPVASATPQHEAQRSEQEPERSAGDGVDEQVR